LFWAQPRFRLSPLSGSAQKGKKEKMFSKIKEWVKTHKQFAFNILVVVIIFFFLFSGNIRRVSYNMVGSKGSYGGAMYGESYAPAPLSQSFGREEYVTDASYESMSNDVSVEDRKVITNSSFSLHVKNVDDITEKIRQKTYEMKGFMVNTNVRRDEGASSAVLEVRVPTDQLVEFSKYLKTIAVKVVYENITGSDITDQYVDYEERLSSLQGVKARFEEIMEEAETVDEIMRVQNSILSIQRQIDQVKGQLTYMDRATATSKVTITLSTDELSLPYTPVKSWRPDVIMKEAVRALISVFRAIGTVGIWAVVFIPLVILLIALKIAVKYLFRKRTAKK